VSRTRLSPDQWSAVVVTAGSVLLGAPAGLLWSALSPRAIVTVTAQGPEIPDVESNKSFIGADGSYLLVMLGMGLLCGLVAWWLFRRSGPWAVLALVVGGSIAGVVAATVGVLPGADAAVHAVSPGSPFRGSRELYLGRLHDSGGWQTGSYHLSVRAVWAFVGWPIGACLAFFAALTFRPEQLD
jgi:hypothetical protein